MELIAHLGRRQMDEGGTLVNRSLGGDGGKHRLYPYRRI